RPVDALSRRRRSRHSSDSQPSDHYRLQHPSGGSDPVAGVELRIESDRRELLQLHVHRPVLLDPIGEDGHNCGGDLSPTAGDTAMKNLRVSFAVGLFALVGLSAVARADDKDILKRGSVPPNVMIVFGNSQTTNQPILGNASSWDGDADSPTSKSGAAKRVI